MADLIKTSLGVFSSVGVGLPRNATSGVHTVTASVSGAGAVSASVKISGSNNLTDWTLIATLSPSGAGSAVSTATWSTDYQFWRAETTSLTGAVVDLVVSSDQTGAGGLGTKLNEKGQTVVDDQTRLVLRNSLIQSAYKFLRRPTNEDCASKGHSLASIWANAREIYIPSEMTGLSATWERQHFVGGFSTAGMTGVQFAGGLFQVVPGYSGPAFDIVVTTSSTPTTYTINIANGRLDVETLEHRLAMADAGTLVPVRQLYDQSGAGNHAARGALTGDLYLDYDEALKSYVIVGDYPAGTQQAAGLDLPVGVSTTTKSATVAVVGRATFEASSTSFGILGASRSAAAATSVLVHLREGRMTKSVYTSGALNRQTDFNAVYVDQQPCVAVMRLGATNAEVSVNGVNSAVSHSVATTATHTGGVIGTDDPTSAGNKFGWRMAGCIITNAPISDAQVTRLTYGACRNFNVRPQVTDSIYVIADSRNGYGGRLNKNWPHLLANHAEQDWRVLNWGVGGHTVEQLQTRHMAQLALQTAARPGAKHVGVLLGDVNDFQTNNRTPEDVYGYIKTLAANFRANGGTHFLVITGMRSASTANGTNTKVESLRALVLAGGAAALGADLIVDVSSLPGFDQPSNTTYYYDGTHPTQRLHSLIASAVWSSIQQLAP